MVFEKLNKRMEQFKKLYLSNAPERLAALEQSLLVLEERERALQKRLDGTNNRNEISPAMIAEFQAWKASHPVPATPLVSICVGTYNRAELLIERCVTSLQKQTYDHFELIIAGDHCTDDTEARIAKLGDKRIRFVNLPMRGPYPVDPHLCWMVAGSCSMNKAMSLAQGDYITHLDDDDEHLPDRLEKLVAFATANEYDFVWHPFWVQKADESWFLNEAPEYAFTYVTTSSVLYRTWLKNITWDVDAYKLFEPGDWNRFRRIKYIDPVSARYPEPLLRHYREKTQHKSATPTS